MDYQNDQERILDQLRMGLITADEANVKMVLNERVRTITTSLPRSVRSALNAAVKDGRLGHLKKDGLRPEVYYNPNFKHIALDERERYVYAAISAIRKVCA